LTSDHLKTIERLEGWGTLYDGEKDVGKIIYRLVVMQTIHHTSVADGSEHEVEGATETRGVIEGPDLEAHFGKTRTLRLDDGRTIKFLVFNHGGSVVVRGAPAPPR
jgi:hypothetical protein